MSFETTVTLLAGSEGTVSMMNWHHLFDEKFRMSIKVTIAFLVDSGIPPLVICLLEINTHLLISEMTKHTRLSTKVLFLIVKDRWRQRPKSS